MKFEASEELGNLRRGFACKILVHASEDIIAYCISEKIKKNS